LGRFVVRRILCVWVLIAAGLSSTPATANASNFGGYIRDNTPGILYGTRASIKTPTTDINWGSGHAIFLARVDAELDGGGSGGLYQGGIGETGNHTELDGGMAGHCGYRDTWHRFQEQKNFTSSAVDYECQWFGPPAPGENDAYSVVENGSSYWEFDINGALKVISLMNFSSANYLVAGDEFNNGVSSSFARQVSVAFGTSGSTDWQRTSTLGGGGWYTISNDSCSVAPAACNTDGLWSRGSLPTPFTASHP
jgi:hypothetical protein